MKLPIPEAVLDQHVFVPGKTRTGKSSVLRSLAEWELHKQIPTTIIDPKGDWWGLRSDRDGKRPGFPVIIFGGDHADVALFSTMGVPLAELCIETDFPILIDVSEFSIAERTRFMCDFLARYFKGSKGTRRSLYADEAHHFAPKGTIPDPQVGKMLHWMNKLAAEGLGRGIRLRVASQRPQKVHNDLLTSCETIIAMKVLHAADRKALQDWFDGAGDKALSRKITDELHTLERGEGFVWSPEAGVGPEKVSFPLFTTYDSFKPQGTAAAPTARAHLDLDRILKQFSKYQVEAENNDPRHLKARIKALQEELEERPVKEPNLDELAHHYREGWRDCLNQVHQRMMPLWDQVGAALDDARGNFVARLGMLQTNVGSEPLPTSDGVALTSTPHPERKGPHRAPRYRLNPASLERIEIGVRDPQPTDVAEVERLLRPGQPPEAYMGSAPVKREGGAYVDDPAHFAASTQGRILAAVRWMEEHGENPAAWPSVAVLAGVTPGGGFALRKRGELTTQGLLQSPARGYLELTDAGRDVAPQPPAFKSKFEAWREMVTGVQRDILDTLHNRGPCSKKELAEMVGKAVEGGFFLRQLGALKTLGAVLYERQSDVSLSSYVMG